MIKSAQVDHRGRSSLTVALGDVIRELRIGRSWSQAQVAALLGLHVKTYATYEQGIRAISLETFVEFCNVFRVDPSLVVGEVLQRESTAVRIATILAASSTGNSDVSGAREEYPVPLAKPGKEKGEGDD